MTYYTPQKANELGILQIFKIEKNLQLGGGWKIDGGNRTQTIF
jgi:hypothetical protein